jgi:hypothetical protein
VYDSIAAFQSIFYWFWISEIAGESIAVNAFEVGEVAGFADKQAEFGALSRKSTGHMMADKTGGACKEDFHREMLTQSFILIFHVPKNLCPQAGHGARGR